MRLRLVPRETRVRFLGLRVALAALALSIAAGALIFHLAGAPPIDAFAALLREPFTSRLGISETLLTATPLLLCGLAVALAYRVGLWNIGAEGQLYMGAFAAAGLALYSDLSGPLAIPTMALAGAMAGALWAAIPALLKVHGRVNEVLSTLMLNYVAIAWVELLVFGPWKGRDRFPYTEYIAEAWQLPTIMGRTHLGLVVAVVAAISLHLLLRVTVFGYEVRIIGASPDSARYAGIPAATRSVAVMALAGAMAGLAGAFEVSGVAHRLHASISPGYGYTAIIIAFLARANPLAVIGVAVAFAGLTVGGEGLQIEFPELSSASVSALQGVVLVSVLCGEGLMRYRLVLDSDSDSDSEVKIG